MISHFRSSVSVPLSFMLLAIFQPCASENLGTKPYNLYWSRTGDTNLVITFSLEVKQHVNVQLIDMKGHLILDKELSEVMNQTFYLETTNQGAGLYIVRLIINTTCYTDKVYINT